MATQRTFYRCPQCLVIVALEKPAPSGFFCDNCKTDTHSAAFEFMGQVSGNRLISEKDRCPCDDRCTSARGPNCECSCGGENHGIGWVTIVIDVGGVPSVTQAKGAVANLAAWHDFQDRLDALTLQAKARFGDDFGRYLNREWISHRETWYELYAVFEAVRKAKKLKTPGGRVKAIEKMSARLAKVAEAA